ncbi:glutamyl-tRNA synthetase [Stella humosa]|uniref:Glutamate--tRNA ligase n=1 Tax=Stella humosa TaxID=94 RepID=A0A3N1MD40_9PROT|nr:glutamate--tRNA ligase [Stella humosa]ROQ01641.1 glutamyl-tRNA synthetase [Stella humosa]BBK32022.1 glutamate--tRNA ligase 2 [Stella humosa]
MTVVTRFAPSPTGYLHIGGARTALFNWLFSRHHGGVFRLRIEDTDRQRSTDAAVEAIIDGLGWLGLAWDDAIVFQFARAPRHAEVALKMLDEGRAYRCWASPEELEEMRAKARAEGRPIRYDGRWRDRDPAEGPAGVKPVIRLRAPQIGETVIDDMVQGQVRVANEQLDDMVLLRADGTPTYMLSVVVDDHDMDVTHVIRGDDHLTNAFRQTQIYRAMGWDVPGFAHIPLIHGPDGAKLSKRHGALGVDAYRDMGYLPEALCNYLLRLGWGHGDDEIIPAEQAIALFDLDGVGRSPSRLDFDKLGNLNGHYLRQADDDRLMTALVPFIAGAAGHTPDAEGLRRLRQGMGGLKVRAKTLKELAELAAFYVRQRPLPIDDKARRLLDEKGRGLLERALPALAAVEPWSAETVESAVRALAEQEGTKLGQVAQPLRAALAGSTISPGIFEVIEILGREETLGRIRDAAMPV